MSWTCGVAWLRHFTGPLCVPFLLLASATAQLPDAPSAMLDVSQRQNSLTRYIRAVPKSPEEYEPISGKGRLEWFVRSTVGPRSLTAGLFSSGYGTAVNSPHEYGTHWSGFGDRYGMRLTGIVTGNAIEAGLGSVWGEDPRYFHTVHAPVGTRAKNVLDLTFRAYHPDGQRHLAYARFAAEFGNNFLSNTWRVQSEADPQHALIRTAEGFGGRALSNAVSEFVPQLWRKVRHTPDPYPIDMHNP
jgi:hypothetical protein